MSKTGRAPILIPKGVKVYLEDNKVVVEGEKGRLSRELPNSISVDIEENKIIVKRESDLCKPLHGLTRSLLKNMVTGVSLGFEKLLSIEGVGYRASLSGENLILEVGFSHPVSIKPPKGTKIEVLDSNTIKVSGIEKDLVGEVAARIRRVRPPDPYKGKGIRYANEEIKKKPGKVKAGTK